jgi:hypothetical protein
MKTTTRFVSNPQALVFAVQPSTAVAILPRGGGKTSNVAPFWFKHRVDLMPKGASGIIGSTYKQLLSRTLPPFLSTLKEMGFIDGVDFVIRKKPPAFWECEQYVKPESFEDTILWSNGHVTYLISQDRAGSPNSLSLQFHLIDEARYLNKARYDDDAAPTLRAGHVLKQLYGQLPEYLSTLYITDQPTTASARWIFDFEQYHDDRLIAMIVNIFSMMVETERKMDTDISKTEREALRRSYNNLKDMYDILRKDAVLFIEGTLVDTVQILGKDAIRKMKRTMKPHRFNVSILGKRAKQIIGSFYPDLDDDIHCYNERYNYDYVLHGQPFNGDRNNWRQDADLDTSLPLRLGSDHGARYNGFWIGQFKNNKLYLVNNIWVVEPEVNMDAVEKLHKYYEGFPSNEIIFYYDSTHIAKSGKALNVTFVDEVVDYLRSKGWTVRKVYIGATPAHIDRFNLASSCLRGKPGFPRIEFNRAHTQIPRDAIHDTMALSCTTENDIKKDKAPEKDIKLSPELAPHAGDGFDTLLWGVCNPDEAQQEQGSSFPGFVSSR